MADHDALREIAAVFGIEWEDERLQRGVQTINGAIGVVRQFAGVVAGSAVVRGIVEFTDRFAEQANAVGDAAERYGLAADEMQGLSFAAENAGVNGEQFNAVLATLSRNASGAATGNATAAAAFQALGIRAADAHGQTRPLVDLLDDLGDGFDRIDDPARRVALAQQLLGEAGARLLPVLHAGAGGVAALREEFEGLGGAIDHDAIESAQRYRQAMLRWRVASDGVRAQLANALLPVMTNVVGWVGQAVGTFNRLTQGTNVVRLAMAGMGAAGSLAAARLLYAWLPVLRPFLGMAAVVAAVILVLDDLITLFRGGDSVIGRFLDSMGGVGASARFVGFVREAWEGMQHAAQEAYRYLSEAWQGMSLFASQAATAIRQVFGEMFAWIDQQFGGMFSRLGRYISNSWLGRLGRGIANVAGGVARDWANIINGSGLNAQTAENAPRATTRGVTLPAAAPAPTPAATPAPTRPPQVTVTQRNEINVHGVESPNEAATRVLDELNRNTAAAFDAAHPVWPGDRH